MGFGVVERHLATANKKLNFYFSQEFDFEKNLALFDKRLVFEEISASNQPDVVRLVDINRVKQTPTQFSDSAEPKFRNDQVRSRVEQFSLFSLFSHEKYSTNTLNDKRVDGVLGTRTRAVGW